MSANCNNKSRKKWEFLKGMSTRPNANAISRVQPMNLQEKKTAAKKIHRENPLFLLQDVFTFVKDSI
jgi:hypothetical protein